MNKRGEGRIGIAGTLVLILMVLKIVGVIHCSWLVVFAPIIIDIILTIVILVNLEWWSKR